MNWICCQLGAREHYALPRALNEQGNLERLYTDVWLHPGSMQSTIIKHLMPRLSIRSNAAISSDKVTEFTHSALLFESKEKLFNQHNWFRIFRRNQWFQKKVVNTRQFKEDCGSSNSPVVFCYSYAALEILRYANLKGCKTVLGQIDGGPVEEDIVFQAMENNKGLNPVWQRSPANYWDNWRDECDIADRIIVNSEWSKAALVKSGIEESKLSVIPLMYEKNNNDNFKCKDYPEKFTNSRPLRVLFLGSMIIRKGIAELFQAIDSMQHLPVEFIFVGQKGVDIPPALANNNRVKLIGPVTVPATENFYRTSDLFILPTLSDGFGLTQLEAMGHGLPVIASRNCGAVVEHEQNGLILSQVSAGSIVQALTRCLENPSLLSGWSRHALDRVRQFAPTNIIHMFISSVHNI